MTNKNQLSTTKLGLKKLTQEDIELISTEIYEFARESLSKRIPERKMDSYDIIIDVNNDSQDLVVDVDIILNFKPRYEANENPIIEETLAETFSKLDRFLKENFTN